MFSNHAVERFGVIKWSCHGHCTRWLMFSCSACCEWTWLHGRKTRDAVVTRPHYTQCTYHLGVLLQHPGAPGRAAVGSGRNRPSFTKVLRNSLKLSVRHATLLDKIARLQIPDNVYNWLVDCFDGHEHCTAYGGHRSSMLSITASIIQGSAIGPTTYIVTAAELRTVSPIQLNFIYADDTYLIIPASNDLP